MTASDPLTARAESRLLACPSGAPMTLDGTVYVCLCGAWIAEHHTYQHSRKCATLRARVSEGGAK